MLMLVGKRGGADWLAYTNECWLDAPCPAQVTAELRSSDSSVVTPALQRGRGPQLFFFAMAPGQAYVKLSAQRFKDSILVTVVSEPLPLDDIYVNSGSPADSVLQLQRDSTGNLVGVVLPVRGYAAVWAQGRRAGYQVGMNWTVESSDSAVVAATRNCRPATVDPQCNVVSAGWITGLTPGSATVTFVMRNVRRQVTIVVQ
jgi:hypothetical protein